MRTRDLAILPAIPRIQANVRLSRFAESALAPTTSSSDASGGGAVVPKVWVAKVGGFGRLSDVVVPLGLASRQLCHRRHWLRRACRTLPVRRASKRFCLHKRQQILRTSDGLFSLMPKMKARGANKFLIIRNIAKIISAG